MTSPLIARARGYEQAGAGAMRVHLTKERKLPKNRPLVAAYWRRGHEGVDIAA